jgi:nitrogenase molybdenum-cofactor synthesis protein NifE
MIEMVRRMDIEINNPVWAQVRLPAPWDDEVAPPATISATPIPLAGAAE